MQTFVKDLAHLSLEMAGQYAQLICDTPELDEEELLVVRTDTDEILARVRIPEDSDD